MSESTHAGHSVLVLLSLIALTGVANPTHAIQHAATETTALCAGADEVGRVTPPWVIEDSLENDAPSARVDFYRLDAEPGLDLVVDMTDQLGEPSSLRNPLLGLFDANCQLLAYNDDLREAGSSSLDARLRFPVPESGVFILAAAASPDIGFDGSSDDVGTYTLRVNRSAPLPVLPAVVEPPLVHLERAADGRIELELHDGRPFDGLNLYRDGQYVHTIRTPAQVDRFRFDGVAGDYCVVAFVESGDLTRYSRCSESTWIGAGGPMEGPPTSPQALRAIVYSQGVVELFWREGTDDGRIVAYRVYRDGAEVVAADVRSLVLRNLDPNRIHRFEVTAVDDDGMESASTYLDVRPRFTGRLIEQPPAVEEGDKPAPPGRLRGTLYSSGAAELFWERSPDHPWLAGYEISRDGARVAFHHGSSHFQPRLPQRTRQQWSVVAIGAGGARSTPRSLILEDGIFTPLDDSSSDALINRVSYNELLAHAFELYSALPYRSALLGLTSRELDLSDRRISQDTSRNPIQSVYVCDEGQAEQATLFSGTNFGEVHDWRFADCLYREFRYHGSVNIHENARGPTFRSPGLSITSLSGNGLRFSGMAQWWTSQTAFFDRIHSWDNEALTLDLRTLDGHLALERATTRFAYGADNSGRFTASLEGGFAVRSDKTAGALIHASTPLALHYASAVDAADVQHQTWNFSHGQLELIAEDGSRVLLDADTGNPNTVQITIDNTSGPDSFIARWTHWQPNLRFPGDSSVRVERP